MQKTTIQIQKSTQQRLKEAGTMNDTYDSVINRLLEEHRLLQRIDHLVETQHTIAKKGTFVELD